MTEQTVEPQQPNVPTVAQLRELTVHARAIVDQLSGLSGATDADSAHYARVIASSAGDAWQYVRERVSDRDANSFAVGFNSLVSMKIPLADAPADLRAEAELCEQALHGLAQEFKSLLLPLLTTTGQGLRPDLAAELARRLPQLADLLKC